VLKLKAHVHQGRLKLDEPYDAPEGAEVDLAVVDDGLREMIRPAD
jgi:hypothetical protein